MTNATNETDENDTTPTLVEEKPAPTKEVVVQQAQEAIKDLFGEGKITGSYPIDFERGSDAILAYSMDSIDQLAEALKASPDVKIDIIGHASSSGKRAFNMELSNRRALAVKRALVERGVEEGRLRAYGRGELDANQTWDDPKDRRTEIKQRD